MFNRSSKQLHCKKVAFGLFGLLLLSIMVNPLGSTAYAQNPPAQLQTAGATATPLVLNGHTDTVLSVAWSPDGKIRRCAPLADTRMLCSAWRGHRMARHSPRPALTK